MLKWELLLAVTLPTIAAQTASAVEPVAVSTPTPKPDAAPSPKILYLGAGVLFYNTGMYANQVTGQSGFGGELLPELSVMGRFALGSGWGISPLLSYTPLGHKSPEGGETTTVLRIEARGTRSLARFLDVQLGFGLADEIINGAGGTVDLNNGNGVTTFGIPSGSSSACLFYWEAGVSVEVIGPLRLEGSAFMTGPLSTSRALSYTISLSYGLI